MVTNLAGAGGRPQRTRGERAFEQVGRHGSGESSNGDMRYHISTTDQHKA